MNRYFTHLSRFDWLLFGAVGVLLTFGMMAIASVGLSHEPAEWGNFWKQLIVAGVGMGFVVFGSAIDYRRLQGWSRLLYVLGIILLVLVLVFGRIVRGTKGWFVVGGLTLQPVEFVKVFLLLFLAKYFSRWARDVDHLRHILLSGVGTAVLAVLTFVQPDLGSSLLLVLVWFGMLLLVGVKKRYIALIVGCAAILGVLAWSFVLQEYQKTRVVSFLNPAADPYGSGYNVAQAKIAVGSGQLFGRGLGFGSQSQLRFLPEAETDFVFAVIAEELGFVGVTILLGAWLVIFWRLLMTARLVHDDFGLFFLLGATLLLFIEFGVNIGVNLGFVPVTGITLPFVSYGGSSLLAHCILLWVIESIAIRRGQAVEEQ